jgi:carboxylesterase type B
MRKLKIAYLEISHQLTNELSTCNLQTAQPKQPWSGVRETKAPGPECLQLSLPKTIRVLGSEDCLYLNVYTPQVHIRTI